MRLAKLFDSSASFSDQMFGDGQHDAEEGRVEEARKAGESLHALFLRESLRELQARCKLRESLKFNANHHVHRFNE